MRLFSLLSDCDTAVSKLLGLLSCMVSPLTGWRNSMLAAYKYMR